MYYLYINKKGKKGLMNRKGKIVLKDEYLDIGKIDKGKCMVWKNKKDEPREVDLLK